MKADYITLTDGRKVRIEWNWNAALAWSMATGKELTDLANGKANPAELRTIAWCAAAEGESADGRELGLSEIEFGRLVNMQGIIEFSKILTDQSSVLEQKKSAPPDKLPRIFFRRKV